MDESPSIIEEKINTPPDKPSKKLYSDYYAVINNPMDMKTINERIKADMYKTVEDFMQGKA